ncbi:MAG: TlpA disulfide reductase family protein [Bacteroidales bacterium]
MENISLRNKGVKLYFLHIFCLKNFFCILLLLSVVFITGCRKNSVTVTGHISGIGEGEYLLLREVKPGVLEPIDSVIPGQDGTFTFRTETKWPSFYMLSAGTDDFLTILASPGEKIRISADRNSLSSPSDLTGSKGTSVMNDFRKDQQIVIKELESLTKVYNDSIMSKRLPLIMDSLDRRAADIVAGFREKAVTMLDDNSSSMVSIYLLNQQVVPGLQLFDPAKDPQIYYRVDSLLYEQYPESDLVLDLHNFVSGLRKSVSINTIAGGTIKEGDILPDIALPDPEGDTISLSSKRGSIVLVDFWAAWCPPCREENPNLVKLYDMYHYRGFDIFQVSLDQRKEDWTGAIRNDRLGRWTHVSDLKYRDSEVVKRFGLSEIPANFLIDRNGRVIASNLRGPMLQKKLEELFSQQ